MAKSCTKCSNGHATSEDKWRYTLLSTLIFLLVVNPYTYKLVNALLGKVLYKICDKSGCPTMFGLFVHTVVFTLAIRYAMDLNI